jgi:hypothetical protein
MCHLDLTPIVVTFSDGTFECRGRYSLGERSKAEAADSGTLIEQAATAYVEVVEDGVLRTEDGDVSLEPGDYLVCEHGLFRRVTA